MWGKKLVKLGWGTVNHMVDVMEEMEESIMY